MLGSHQFHYLAGGLQVLPIEEYADFVDSITRPSQKACVVMQCSASPMSSV